MKAISPVNSSIANRPRPPALELKAPVESSLLPMGLNSKPEVESEKCRISSRFVEAIESNDRSIILKTIRDAVATAFPSCPTMAEVLIKNICDRGVKVIEEWPEDLKRALESPTPLVSSSQRSLTLKITPRQKPLCWDPFSSTPLFSSPQGASEPQRPSTLKITPGWDPFSHSPWEKDKNPPTTPKSPHGLRS